MNPPAMPAHAAPPIPTEATSLRHSTLRSLRWVVAMQVAQGTMYFAGPAVLANITTAENIGTVELGLAVFFVASRFIELGTGPAIIQKPQLDQAFLSTVFFVNIATGLLFGGVLFAGAPFLTAQLHVDLRFAHFLKWVALSFVLYSAAIVPRSLLTRRMAFRSLAAVDGVAVAAACGVAFVSIQGGKVTEGLIAALMTYAGATCVGLWALGRWMPSWSFERHRLPSLFRFSLSVSAARTIDNISAQWERFLVASLLSPADLGLYALARNLHRTPLRHLMQVSDTVLMPALSAIQSDRTQCRRYYLSAVRLEFAVVGPLLALLTVSTPSLVPLVYGQGWDQLNILVYLTIPVTMRIITAHTVGAVFLSQGRADVQLRWVMVQFALTTLSALVGSPWGIQGLAVSVLVLGFAGWFVSHSMANRLIDLEFSTFLRHLAMPFAATLLLAALLWPAGQGLRLQFPGAHLWHLLLTTCLAAPLYAAILRVLAPTILSDLRRAVRDAAGRG